MHSDAKSLRSVLEMNDVFAVDFVCLKVVLLIVASQCGLQETQKGFLITVNDEIYIKACTSF